MPCIIYFVEKKPLLYHIFRKKEENHSGRVCLSFVLWSCEWNTKHSLQIFNQDSRCLEVMISPGLFVRRIFNVPYNRLWLLQRWTADLNSAEYFVLLKLDKSCWREVCELERTISDWVMTTAAQPPSRPSSMQSPKWRLSSPYRAALYLCMDTVPETWQVFFILTVSYRLLHFTEKEKCEQGELSCLSKFGIFGANCVMLMCTWMLVHIHYLRMCVSYSLWCVLYVCVDTGVLRLWSGVSSHCASR